jgi:hypothetical protein
VGEGGVVLKENRSLKYKKVVSNLKICPLTTCYNAGFWFFQNFRVHSIVVISLVLHWLMLKVVYKHSMECLLLETKSRGLKHNI